MNKKNGFTLIELLAVLIVLSLIAVITVPVVLNILDNSKKDVSKNSAHRYVDAVNKYYVSNELNHVKQELPNGYKLVSELPSDFSVSGDEPTSDSWLKLENGEVIAYSLKFGDYVVTKYTVGDPICLKGDVQENEEEREIRLAREAVSSKVDSYVKAALSANSSLSYEEAKTVDQMSDVTVDVPDLGWIHFGVEAGTVSVVDYSLTYGDFTVNYSALTDGKYVSTFDGARNKPIVVAIGREKCYGPEGAQECFKIINKFTEKDENGNDVQKVMLFANYNLKKDKTNNTYRQDENPDQISIASTAYWHDKTNGVLKEKYSKDLNGNAASYSGNPYPYIYSSENNAYAYIEGYLTLLKTDTYGLPDYAIGRLLTREEASDSSIFADAASRWNGKNYWLASAYSASNGWYVTSNMLNKIIYNNCWGVRPVIIVNAVDLQ